MTDDMIWTGIIEVTPGENSDILSPGSLGAMVNVAARATDVRDFLHKVVMKFEEMKLEVKDAEYIEPLTKQRINNGLTEEIKSITDQVREDDDVVFGTFHNYLSEDDD